MNELKVFGGSFFAATIFLLVLSSLVSGDDFVSDVSLGVAGKTLTFEHKDGGVKAQVSDYPGDDSKIFFQCKGRHVSGDKAGVANPKNGECTDISLKESECGYEFKLCRDEDGNIYVELKVKTEQGPKWVKMTSCSNNKFLEEPIQDVY